MYSTNSLLFVNLPVGVWVINFVKMDDELRKAIGVDLEPSPPEEKKAPAKEPEISAEDQEIKAKEERKANLDKAIAEAQETLRGVRKDIKKVKTQPVEEEEELPKINLEDPSAKAWDRRIRENSAPMQAEIEKAKEERRTFALRQFLTDKPALSKNPDKIKSLMGMYERIHSASELTTEGILLDLGRAYAADNSEELINRARSSRVEDVRNDEIFSDIAISRGATGYPSQKDDNPKISEDDKAQLAKWGMSPAEWVALKKKYK